MKVSVATLKSELVMFETKLIAQTNNLTNKSALAVIFKKFMPHIEKAISANTVNGLVDVEEIKGLVEAGIEGGGGKIVLHPQLPAWTALLGVDIVDVTITREEAKEFFDNLAAKAEG